MMRHLHHHASDRHEGDWIPFHRCMEETLLAVRVIVARVDAVDVEVHSTLVRFFNSRHDATSTPPHERQIRNRLDSLP